MKTLYNLINLIRIKLLQLNIRKAKKTSTVYEPYIDDQVEIEKIWIICEDLIKSGKIAEFSRDIRREILQEIIQGEYFDEYGVSDPMKELFFALCITKKELIYGILC